MTVKNRKPPPGAKQNFSHPLAEGLIGRWLMNEGGGTKVKNLAGTNLYDGAIGANAPYNAGRFGKTLNFTAASSQYVTMGNQAIYDFTGLETFSIAFWAKQVAVASQVWVSKQISGGLSNGWFLATKAGTGAGAIRFVGRETTVASIDVYSNITPFNDTNWHHIVFTHNGSRTAAGCVFYVDGVLAGTTTVTDLSVASWTNTAALNMGARNATDVFLDGKMEDVRIYNRVLPLRDVKQLYTQPFCDVISPLRKPALFVAAAGGSLIKTFSGLVNASTKTVDGLANASVKTWGGLSNV